MINFLKSCANLAGDMSMIFGQGLQHCLRTFRYPIGIDRILTTDIRQTEVMLR